VKESISRGLINRWFQLLGEASRPCACGCTEPAECVWEGTCSSARTWFSKAGTHTVPNLSSGFDSEAPNARFRLKCGGRLVPERHG
jgi:hypothetical protein